MLPVTMRIPNMIEQDKYFAELEPSPFKRVFLMAADIRRKVDIERKIAEEEREERRKLGIKRGVIVG